jgi:hypothetical protein
LVVRVLKPVVVWLPIIGIVTLVSLVFTVRAGAECSGPEGLTETVEGDYLSTECGDHCHVYVKLDDGREAEFVGGQGETEGLEPGARVMVSSQRVRFWSVEPADCVTENLVVKVERIR